jgi:hypothetical protein
MLLLRDTQVCSVVLSYIAAQVGEGCPGGLREAGLDFQNLADLRELSAFNLKRLAAMRDLKIVVSLDCHALKSGLRNLGLVREAKSLEVYFLRNGASCRMMRALFKMGRRDTLERRRQWGARQPQGKVRLPPLGMRRNIFKVWQAKPQANLRLRYYQLHQTFPQYSIAALEAVVRSLEHPS